MAQFKIRSLSENGDDVNTSTTTIERVDNHGNRIFQIVKEDTRKKVSDNIAISESAHDTRTESDNQDLVEKKSTANSKIELDWSGLDNNPA